MGRAFVARIWSVEFICLCLASEMKKFSIYTWKISMKFESNKFKFHLNYVIWRIHCESLSSAHQDQIPIIYGDSSHLISASLLLFKLKIQCKPESASLFCFVFPWIIYLWNLNDKILWISCSWNCFFFIFFICKYGLLWTGICTTCIMAWSGWF